MIAKASLPMYDWPEIRAATDEFWREFSEHAGISGALLHGEQHDHLWRDPAMVFSQTCGYPFTHEFSGQLKYIATPHYDCEGCVGAEYSSFVFARNGHFKISVPAINSMDSMSGMLALKLVLQNLGAPLITGSHVASLKAVQSGLADVCAVDAVVVELARLHRPYLLEGLVQIGQSPLVPGLPFVTRAGDVSILREALRKTFADPALAKARELMRLTGYSILSAEAYDVIPQLERAITS